MSISRMYRVHRSNLGHYTVKCVVEGYPSKVSAHKAKFFGMVFTGKVVIDHTCELSEPQQQHQNASSVYVASLISHLVGKFHQPPSCVECLRLTQDVVRCCQSGWLSSQLQQGPMSQAKGHRVRVRDIRRCIQPSAEIASPDCRIKPQHVHKQA